MHILRKFLTNDIGYASFWLAIVVLLFFLPVVIGRQSLTQDVPAFYSAPSPAPQVQIPWQVDPGTHTLQTVPFVRAGIELLKQGVIPLWAAYTGGGQILANDPATTGLLYPLRLIFFLVWNSARAFDWYFMLRFFIAGLGMFFYLRTIGLRRIVALWGGIAYAFTGYLVLYISYPFLDIDALLPWTLWAIERYCRKKNAANAAFIGFFVAMTIVIAQPQSTVIAFILAALYFCWRIMAQGGIEKKFLKSAYHSLLIILIALLIASPFIADFLTLTSQGATVKDWMSKGLLTFKPIQILNFLVAPAMMPEVAFSGHLLDRYEYIIPYVGISVLILLLLSLFIKKKPPQLAPLYAWTAFVILKNAGVPVVSWLGKLPILNQVGWYKAYGPMAGALVICAAIAFEYLLRESGSRNFGTSAPKPQAEISLPDKPSSRDFGISIAKPQAEISLLDGRGDGTEINWGWFYKLLAAIPLAFGAAYIFFRNAFTAAYVPNFDFFNRHPEMIEKVMALIGKFPHKIQEVVLYVIQNHGGYLTILLFAEAIFFAAITLIIISCIRKKRRYAAVCLVFLTAFELWWYMPKIRDGFQYIDPYAKTPPYVSFLQNQIEKGGASRTFSFDGVFGGYLGELYKIQQSQNNGAIKSRRYSSFLPDKIVQEDALGGTIAADKLAEVPEKFFDAFNIRYLLSEQPLPNGPWLKLTYDNDIKIYENQNALPKAYVVFQKESASSAEEARKIFYDTPFDPHNSVILEDQNALNFPQATSAISYVPAIVTRYTDNEIDVATQTDRDGILVLTDIFYPGWQAYLDGKKVATYPANVMFRGIYLPGGNHTVRFAYEPWWFWPSMTVSLLTLSSVIFLLFRRSKKENGAESVALPTQNPATENSS